MGIIPYKQRDKGEYVKSFEYRRKNELYFWGDGEILKTRCPLYLYHFICLCLDKLSQILKLFQVNLAFFLKFDLNSKTQIQIDLCFLQNSRSIP